MKTEKTEHSELDIAGLLSLKKFERPNSVRAEKNVQNVMRAVRNTSNIPSLLLFPDKKTGWMFAQPRYGVAALFVIFLGLHLLDRPMPVQNGGAVSVIKAPGAEVIAAVDTNILKAASIPGLTPTLYSSLAGEPAPLASFAK